MQSGETTVGNGVWQTRVLTSCLRLSVFCCFAGWAWGHLYWEPSYSSILWSDVTFEWSQNFGYSWDDFAGTGANDGLIQRCVRWMGWLLVGGAILSFTARRSSWIQLGLLSSSALLLLAIAVAKYIKSEFELPVLVEQGGQILSPILLVMALTLGARHRMTVLTAIVAVLTTFAGHGLYATGLWPTPATFIGMTRAIFGWDYDSAKLFVNVAGVLDFAVCCGLLIPFLRRWCVLYAAIWGLLTAAARPAAGMAWDLNYWGADQFLHEFVYRAPHFLIPLFLFLHWSFTQVQHPVASSASASDDSRSA